MQSTTPYAPKQTLNSPDQSRNNAPCNLYNCHAASIANTHVLKKTITLPLSLDAHCLSEIKVLFLKLLPAAVVALVALLAAVFLATPAPVAPLLLGPKTPFLALADLAVFRVTVLVLLAVDSLASLPLRSGLITGTPLVILCADVGTGFLVDIVMGAISAALGVVASTRLVPVSLRAERAFSAKLLKNLGVLNCFTGDLSGLRIFSAEGVGRILVKSLPPGVCFGKGRMFPDAGDRTVAVLADSTLFLGEAVSPPWFLL